MRALIVPYLALVASSLPAAELRTIAEQSDYQRTGRYDEVERLCLALQTTAPKQVRCFEFGVTPEGRRMLALAVSGNGALDAAAAKRSGRPIVMMQGGIHAGEIDGKDAGFWVIREMLEGKVAQSALSKVVFVFIPVFNVDGHERFGRWNRPNQVGPVEMGWRTTGQNLNLNRDYVKSDAPEMQAMLRLLNEWDPILYVDLHVTDGADFEHDISFVIEPILSGDDALKPHARALRDRILERLTSAGSLPLPFYPTLLKDDDPTSGIADTVATPRFSQQYWSLRNRIGVLVETHSWKDYKTRVRATRNSIVAMLDQAASAGGNWITSASAADRRSMNVGGTSVPLAYRNTDKSRIIDFRGYRYSRTLSPISGATMTQYDNKQPQIWRMPFYYEVEPAVSARAPQGGYIVIPGHADWVAEKLKLHAIEFTKLHRNRTSQVEAFRATKTTFASASSEGRVGLSVEGEWRTESRELAVGTLFVPIAQRNSKLVLTLFEPASPDSLLAWGFFNSAFERKEYMEAYVAEQVAQEMLAKDPALKAEFERKLKEDAAFAQNPRARLEFFYRRHSSWDERWNLYPVFRVEAVPERLQ